MDSAYMPKSKTVEHGTPAYLFEALDAKWGPFTLDPAATHENAKCPKHYTEQEDGLSQSWLGHTVFLNPPYGRILAKWMEKCVKEWRRHDIRIVALLPVRTDTKWFHDYVLPYCQIEFIRGRLRFEGNTSSAPFPSMVCVWEQQN